MKNDSSCDDDISVKIYASIEHADLELYSRRGLCSTAQLRTFCFLREGVAIAARILFIVYTGKGQRGTVTARERFRGRCFLIDEIFDRRSFDWSREHKRLEL